MAKDFVNHFDKVTFLVNLLTRKPDLTIDEINGFWLEDIYTDKEMFDRFKLRRLRNSIFTEYGIEIKSKRRGKFDAVYFIDNPDDLEDNRSLIASSLQAFSIGEVLQKNKKLFPKILLEEFPSGINWLQPIFDAMSHKYEIHIYYKRYNSSFVRDHQIVPLFIKGYHQRLYLIAKMYNGHICSFSLDRIIKLEKTSKKFSLSKTIDANEYFSNAYGVYVDLENFPPQKVILRAYDDEPNYLRDVPIHKSQRELASGDGYTDFEYFISTTNDFIGKILEQGDRLQVISPQSLVDEVRRRIDNASRRYSDPNKD